jgi:hypothetical protein
MREMTTSVMRGQDHTPNNWSRGCVHKIKYGQIKEIGNSLHVPNLWKNLFLAKQLDQLGGKIIIKFGKCILKNFKGVEIAQCILEVGLYKLEVIKDQNINEIIIPIIVDMNKQIYGI